MADRVAMMMRIAGVAALTAIVGMTVPAPAAVITDRTAYYLCFAYTPDGMFFAGGDYDLRRAKKLLAANCGMPTSTTVVLVRTMMKHAHGKTLTYAAPKELR